MSAVSPVTGGLVANVEFDEIVYTYTGAATAPSIATYKYKSQPVCQISYTYDTSSRIVSEIRYP